MTTPKADVLIQGGLLASGRGVQRADVLVGDGKVAEVGSDLSSRTASRTIDATGKYVLPGAIDSHAHPMSMDKMDAFSTCAAFGGVTTIIAFAGSIKAWGYQAPTTADAIKRFIADSEKISHLDFSVHATFVGETEVEKTVPELIDMGVISFKMFMSYPRRGMMMPDQKMLQVMELVGARGGLVMVHAENGYCIDYLTDKFLAAGTVSLEYYLPSQPNILEAEAFYRAATYARVTGCPLYGVHLSTKEVLPFLRMVREEAPNVFGETCPHYLTLTNDEVLTKGPLGKVGPPLREQVDVEAMWQAVADGTISTIGSDSTGYNIKHKNIGGLAPVPVDEKHPDVPFSGNILEARHGLNTIEYMVPVVFTHGVQRGRITLPRLVQVFCENPAKIFGLYPQKGTLQVGSDADLVVWDPAKETVASIERQHGNTDYCTFEGFQLVGIPVLTMQRGEVVMENGQLVRPQGRARFLPGDPNKAAYAKGESKVE